MKYTIIALFSLLTANAASAQETRAVVYEQKGPSLVFNDWHTLTDPETEVVYDLDVQTGDHVSLTVAGSGGVAWSVHAPSGEVVAAPINAMFPKVTFTATETATYLVRIEFTNEAYIGKRPLEASVSVETRRDP